ncbi:hypothetical protein FQN54_004252 [Arachnomyces sp. PD_36]|nr:hypothetical protein FQN54_004252 [Arachnomyces sp. PD_36]
MATRAKRRRLNGSRSPESLLPENHVKQFPNPPLAQASDDDRKAWQGFCEIESEPALFNVMLRDFGVKGVKVQEVVSLDDEMLVFLHKPVYGLIFLFRWKEDDAEKQEQSCPEGLWFANQTVNNACASVALLNIVNNIEGIELGPALQHFKEFTMPFTPALRGNAIGNFEFIKRVHNSYARKMDMLNLDLQLKNDATAKKSKASKKNEVADESEAGFHFIAFVPALGKVWKFDGLERQPQNLGECPDGDWLGMAKPEILARMAGYEEDQIEFSILGLVKDPIINLVADLAQNVKELQAVRERLDLFNPPAEVPSSTKADNSKLPDRTLLGPDGSYKLTQDDIDKAEIPSDKMTRYTSASQDQLRSYENELVDKQKELRSSVKEEQHSQEADDNHAAGRKHDYASAVNRWLSMLARKKKIEELVNELQ